MHKLDALPFLAAALYLYVIPPQMVAQYLNKRIVVRVSRDLLDAPLFTTYNMFDGTGDGGVGGGHYATVT